MADLGRWKSSEWHIDVVSPAFHAVVDFSCAPVDSTAAHVMLHGVLYPEVHSNGLKNKK